MAKVTLMSYTPNPEEAVACAAKLCYSSVDIETLKKGLTKDKTENFISMLMKMGHESPIEHITFTFGIEKVSRALLAQITRHRIASFSVQSQRYVRENNFEYVIPPQIERDMQAKKEFVQAMEDSIKHYNVLADKLKQNYVLQGMKENQAEKKAIEDARFVLPNACETKIICTFNARSLLNFFSLRCCNRAQWEIRDVATQMLILVKKVAPNIFKNAGPSCVSGGCSEGKMTCGEAVKMRKLFLEDMEELDVEG